MEKGDAASFRFLLLVWALVALVLTPGSLAGQEIAASSATAEGFEGLHYNPAALAAGPSAAAGFSGLYGSAGHYSLSALLSDSLRLDYLRSETAEQLNLLCGLAFPREAAFHVGVRAAAELLDFRWAEVDLAAGLLWYPHRYLAVAAALVVGIVAAVIPIWRVTSVRVVEGLGRIE